MREIMETKIFVAATTTHEALQLEPLVLLPQFVCGVVVSSDPRLGDQQFVPGT